MRFVIVGLCIRLVSLKFRLCCCVVVWMCSIRIELLLRV